MENFLYSLKIIPDCDWLSGIKHAWLFYLKKDLTDLLFVIKNKYYGTVVHNTSINCTC